MKPRFLALLCLGFAFNVAGLPVLAQQPQHQQESVECTRLRIAGQPCPAAPTGRVAPRPASALPRPVAPPPAPSPASPLAPSGAAVAPHAPATRGPVIVVPGSTPAPVLALQPGVLPNLLPLASPLAALTPQRETAEPGQVIAYWPERDEGDAALAALARTRQLLPSQTSRLDNLGGVLAVFQLTTQAEALALRDQLWRDFPGLAVDLNIHYRPLAQPPPRIYLPQKIGMPGPGDRASQAGGVRIGIVDGAVTPIPALLSTRVVRRNFVAGGDVPASPAHATAVAALIAGRDPVNGFGGIAPGASLYSAEIMRAAGQDTLTSSASLVVAVDWLLGEKIQIINLSLGGPGDAVMARVFARLAGMAVMVVAAAGNGGPAAAPSYPAAYPGVVAVTATDAADRIYNAANRGDYIALAAPGVDLWVPDAATGHYVSGTSFSAAVVTAGSALLLARNPLLDGREILKRFCRSARDLGASGTDAVFGCGLVQIGAALHSERP